MAVIRAFDVQATNLQRQGQLALWPPSFGQEAAQVGSARAARPQDHLFPSYREHVVTQHPRRRPDRHHPRDARTDARRVGPDRPEERQHPHLHARARLADAARDRARHGARLRRPLRHRRRRARRGRHRLLRRRRVQPGRRARGDGLRRELPHARGLLPAEQPVGDLGAGRDAVALAAVQARRGLRDAEHPGRRQRRARELGRHARRARRGARRRRAAGDRGDDLPAWARTPRATIPRSTAPPSEEESWRAPRPDRAHEGLPPRPRRVGGVLRRRGRRGRGSGRRHPHAHQRARRPRARRRCSPTCTPSRTRSSTSSGEWLAGYEASFEGGAS